MKKYYRLALEEREEISRLLSQECSLSVIAGYLNRDKSTIYREINRSLEGKYNYRAVTAQKKAERNSIKRRLGNRKLDKNKRLKKMVLEKLKLRWSPEQIANFLKER